MKNTLITLFTGAGGLDWGFNNDNYDLLISNEILEPHLRTYTEHSKIPLIKLEDYTNQTHVGIYGDINQLNIDYKSDVVIGGPPCQDFSLLRGKDKRSGLEVERGRLYEQYLRILKSSNANVFVFENVAGMTSANEGTAYKTIQEDFIKENYELVFNNVINIGTLGAPQARRRLIIIGVKKDIVTDKTYEIVKKYLTNDMLSKYPLTPLEVFEGEILTELDEKYTNIMKKYKDSTKNIDNPEAKKWIKEYESLTLNIEEDYLKINDIDQNETEFKKAMKEHEKILKILNYYHKPIDKQSFPDDTNALPRKNKNVTERMHHIPPFYNFKAVENTE